MYGFVGAGGGVVAEQRIDRRPAHQPARAGFVGETTGSGTFAVRQITDPEEATPGFRLGVARDTVDPEARRLKDELAGA